LRQIIYLDNNATTKIDDEVLAAMLPYLTSEYANANSTHHFGVQSYEAVKTARSQVAKLINADPNEIVFTSGSTEAINLAIKGVADNSFEKGKHIITVKTEHSAVLDTCKFLESKGYEITYLDVKKDGLIDVNSFKETLRADTILVCVMLANNETGVIQPIKELAEFTHKAGALFFTDATQAIGKIPVDIRDLDIDLLCISGHKLYGPKGVGALFIRQNDRRIKVPALIHGGGHENGQRSGTLNVPGIIGLGKACEISRKEIKSNSKRIEELRNYLEEELLKIDGVTINGNIEKRLYNTSNLLIAGVDSDAAIMGLSKPDIELPLIAISNGSACTSHTIEPSHVLIAMGLNENEAYSCLRISIGKYNTKEEISMAIEELKKVINSLRSMLN
jgi:cysteine desulfurase